MYQDFESNAELVYWEAMKGGDRSSFAWLYDRYFDLLYNYGRKIGTDSALLEDAIHDLFVDLWRFRKNLSSTTSVRFYLYRSLRRRIRRNNAGAQYLCTGINVDDMLDIGTPSSEQEIIEEETHHRQVHQLRKLLNDLSPRQYEALVLRFYDELSFAEIAAILDVNEQSVRNLVQRGLVQLRQYARHALTVILALLLLS